MGNHINFVNAILKNENKIKGEPKVHYILRKYKKKGSYYILTYISESVTHVHLMNYLGNVNHDISVIGYWIFDSNCKRALVLNRESLDMICAPYVGEEQNPDFETVFNAVIYIFLVERLKKD